MEVDDYMNHQESLEGGGPTNCLNCGKPLEIYEENLCDKCLDKALKDDMKAMQEARDQEWEKSLLERNK